MRVYSHLSPALRAEARENVPRAVLQMLSTVTSFTDVTVQAVCLRFLSILFEDHAEIFALSVDLILLKLLVRIILENIPCRNIICHRQPAFPNVVDYFVYLFRIILGFIADFFFTQIYLDDQRLAMRSATVRCLGVFISIVPFSSLESHLSIILRDKEKNNDKSNEQLLHSDIRLKLVTLAILKLNSEMERDGRIGIFSSGTSYQMTITGVARAVVADMFDVSAIGNSNRTPDNSLRSNRSPEKEKKKKQHHSERAISSALDLLAATSLVLCSPVMHRSGSLREFMGTIARNFATKKSFFLEFVDAVLTDDSGVLRVTAAMQEEISKRATERNMLSLNSDSNLSSIADSLLIFEKDNQNFSIPPTMSRGSSLIVSIPTYEPIDSLVTTAETTSLRSNGSMLSTNGTATSPLRSFSSSSNANTPAPQYDYDGNESEGVDPDMDRTKLSALKKSQSRGGSRRQARVGGQSLNSTLGSTPKVAGSTDFFSRNGDRSEEDNSSVGSRSPMARSSRSKTFFSSMQSNKSTNSDCVEDEKEDDYRGLHKIKYGDKDEFSEVSVVPNHMSSFHRPNGTNGRYIDALVEVDNTLSDGDEFDEEIERHFSTDAEYDDNYSPEGQEGDSHGSPDLLALAGESFLQGLGARTAEERVRNHNHRYSNHGSGRQERSMSMLCPQTPVAVGTYGPDGQRTQGLVAQGHNDRGERGERGVTKSMAKAAHLARESRLLAVSPSLPVLSPSELEYENKAYSNPIAFCNDSRSVEFPSLKLGGLGGRDRESTLVSASADAGTPGQSRKIRILRSPRGGQSPVPLQGGTAAPSSSSSRSSSPRGNIRVAGGGMGGTTGGGGSGAGASGGGGGNGMGGGRMDRDRSDKGDGKGRSRVRLTREQEDESQGQEQGYEQETSHGLREYQLAGVS